MEEAKKLVTQFSNELAQIERTEEMMDNLKPAINNLLHMYLPPDLTIEEMEVIALVINRMIWEPRTFLPAKP